MTTPPGTPGNTGGQQPSPPTGQTSAEAGGSIRDRLSSPRPNDQASGPGDTRTSDVGEHGFVQTDSRAQLQSQGRGEHQYDSSKTPRAEESLAGRKHPLSSEDAKAAERKVAALFMLSFVGVVGFVATFFLVDQEFGTPGNIYYTPLLGTFMALALGGVGAGAVLWAKLLMVDEEAVQERHPFGSPKDERSATAQALKKGLEETGLPRRSLLRNTLLLGAGSLALLPVPFLFGLGRFQHKERVLATTAWKEGVRLIRQNGTPGPPGRPAGRQHRERLPRRRARHEDRRLADAAHPHAPGGAADPGGSRGLVLRGPHRLLEHLHAPGVPGEALRAADAPPVLPVPPVDLRRGPGVRGPVRTRRTTAAPTGDQGR
jgi:ubiquinol-cytochrome c reductase iron-sulfur subunit